MLQNVSSLGLFEFDSDPFSHFSFLFLSFFFSSHSPKILFLPPLSRGTLEQGAF